MLEIGTLVQHRVGRAHAVRARRRRRPEAARSRLVLARRAHRACAAREVFRRRARLRHVMVDSAARLRKPSPNESSALEGGPTCLYTIETIHMS